MANANLWGVHNLQALGDRRITEIGVSNVEAAIQQDLTEHNRQMDALIGLFAQRTTDFKVRYQSPIATRLQPLDDDGRARPLQHANSYDVAFPLQMGGGAIGANFVARQKMTAEEMARVMNSLLVADMRWLRDHMLASLFTNASWTFTDPLHGALTVQGLANSDTVTYLTTAGADAAATDTHYLAQASAIDDSHNPYPTIYTELTEHPENAGEVICLIPTSLRATTEALTLFRPISDPNVQPASTSATLIGTLSTAVPGEVIGYVSRCWIVEWKSLPSDYIVATTTQGARPLAMREDDTPSLQGFITVGDRENAPFWERQYVRRAGFGGWNRVGAVIQRIGNGSYAIPTNYDVPMP